MTIYVYVLYRYIVHIYNIHTKIWIWFYKYASFLCTSKTLHCISLLPNLSFRFEVSNFHTTEVHQSWHRAMNLDVFLMVKPGKWHETKDQKSCIPSPTNATSPSWSFTHPSSTKVSSAYESKSNLFPWRTTMAIINLDHWKVHGKVLV